MHAHPSQHYNLDSFGNRFFLIKPIRIMSLELEYERDRHRVGEAMREKCMRKLKETERLDIHS